MQVGGWQNKHGTSEGIAELQNIRWNIILHEECFQISSLCPNLMKNVVFWNFHNLSKKIFTTKLTNLRFTFTFYINFLKDIFTREMCKKKYQKPLKLHSKCIICNIISKFGKLKRYVQNIRIMHKNVPKPPTTKHQPHKEDGRIIWYCQVSSTLPRWPKYHRLI